MAHSIRGIGRTAAVFAATISLSFSAFAYEGERNLLLILDGFRPDYLSAELTPNLHKWSKQGVVFENHHSVFPTVTRVNSSSFATGAYPERHGLMGNSVFFPVISATQGFTTGSRGNLMKVERVTDGNLLTVPSMGEILETADIEMLAVGSGSSGSSFLLNHKGAGGGSLHHSYTLPESGHAAAVETLGPEPADATPNEQRNRRAVDAYLKIGLDRIGPDVTYMWLSDPDHTAHPYGMGSETTNESLRLVDAEFGRILDGLKKRGLYDTTNIFVTSDHGFSTHVGTPAMDLRTLLVSRGLKAGKDSEDVVVVGPAIYVKDRDPERIEAIVRLLQETDWVGAIFTKGEPGSRQGRVPGTFSFELARWDHERGGDILVSANWTDDENEHGFAGTSTKGGVAGHGTSSPWDIHNTLVAAGPDIKAGIEISNPSGNVDLAPTILHLMGLEVPETMQGRVLEEALEGGPDPGALVSGQIEVTTHVHRNGDRYELKAKLSTLGDHHYLDSVKAER